MRNQISSIALLLADIEFQETTILNLFQKAFSVQATYFLEKLKENQNNLGLLGGAYHFLCAYLDEKNFQKLVAST